MVALRLSRPCTYVALPIAAGGAPGVLERWRAEALRRSRRAAQGAIFAPAVAPLRAAELSLHDDKKGVAGLALLYQHGAVLEFLRFECLGDVEPLDNAMMCISEQERKRCLRQRLQVNKRYEHLVLLALGFSEQVPKFVASCLEIVVEASDETWPQQCRQESEAQVSVHAFLGIPQLFQNADLIAEPAVREFELVALCGKEPRGLRFRERVCVHRHIRRACPQRHRADADRAPPAGQTSLRASSVEGASGPRGVARMRDGRPLGRGQPEEEGSRVERSGRPSCAGGDQVIREDPSAA